MLTRENDKRYFLDLRRYSLHLQVSNSGSCLVYILGSVTKWTKFHSGVYHTSVVVGARLLDGEECDWKIAGWIAMVE
jgi:hypothetical protein